MTEPEAQRPVSARAASFAAELVTRNRRNDPLKSIYNAARPKLVDKWIPATDQPMDRLEAIRRLVELGLKARK